MPQLSSTNSLAHAAAQQPLAVQHHAQQAQAIHNPLTAGASAWVSVAAAKRAATRNGAGTENLAPAGVERLPQPACKAAKHSHADTPHCAQQCPRTLAALQVSNETLPQREDHLASATDSGDDSSSCDDSVSASEASHGSYCWSDASKSDNVNSLPASDYTEDESLESGGSPSAPPAICKIGAAA